MKGSQLGQNKAKVTTSDIQKSQSGEEREMIPLSAINQYLFCPRRAALIHVEGIFVDNEHTLLGNLLHDHVDDQGYETVQGVTLLRALPVFSDRLGLSGKCDIVERHPDGSLCPVEYKKGKRRKFENDDAQVCAQALCLEEMFHITINQGFVYHAASKHRRTVTISPELRTLTGYAINQIHALMKSEQIPTAVLRPACEECSLYRICLPEATSAPTRLEKVAKELYEA